MQEKIQCYAVIRHDIDIVMDAEVGIQNAVYITEVLPTEEEARQEVERLNKLNADKNCSYHWQATRFYPQGRKGSRKT